MEGGEQAGRTQQVMVLSLFSLREKLRSWFLRIKAKAEQDDEGSAAIGWRAWFTQLPLDGGLCRLI